MFGNNGPFSYSPRGFSPEDLPQNRRPFQSDDNRVAPLQRGGLSRPNGRSIYMQRKEYSESLTRRQESFSVRVEHLLTCKMNSRDTQSVDDCVSKLKMLDAKGRLWPQEMIMEIQGGYLLLSDIETKVELESMPLGSVIKTKAVLDSCAYNSLLAVMVEQRGSPQVFLFQCEETGAELVKSDLDKACKKHGSDLETWKEPPDIRNNLENIISQHSFRKAGPRTAPPEQVPPTPIEPAPQLNNRDMNPMMTYNPVMDHHGFQDQNNSPELPPPEMSNSERNTEIFNHVLDDLEIFMNVVNTAVSAQFESQKKSKKKMKLKMKKSNKTEMPTLPSNEECMATLQKIKYGFNLLGQLEDVLTSPSAADYVHILFNILNLIVSQYPPELPPAVVSPLLTDITIGLLSGTVTPEEENLWRALGDSWNISRSEWPEDFVPPYIPEFYDGWQPPAPSTSNPSFRNSPISRSNSQRFPSDPPYGMQSPRAVLRQPELMNGDPWGPPPSAQPPEPPLHMRVMYDFMARNNRELSIMKGEFVEVIQKTKQWWLVRNSRNEEGNVPQNVLEPVRSDRGPEDMQYPNSPVTLDMNSSPAEVRAWLEYKGFSKITVNSLGVLTGKLLLGMPKNEIRMVCPEEGGKVFFQLQAIKSAIALASEPSGMYNGNY